MPATPKEINNLDTVTKKTCSIFTYKFGTSILHAHLKCFENVLHINYKLIYNNDRQGGRKRGPEKCEEKKITKCFAKNSRKTPLYYP